MVRLAKRGPAITKASLRSQAGKRPAPDSPSSEPESSTQGYAELIAVVLAQMNAQLEAQFATFRAAVKQDLEDTKKEHSAQLEAQRVTHAAELDYLKTQLEGLARQQRANNLVLRGLPEAESAASPLISRVRSLISNAAPGFNPHTLDTATRLGRTASSMGPRPVLLRFSSRSARGQALQAAKQLRSQRMYFDSDLTPGQQGVRREMKPTWDALKEANRRPFWRDELLRYFEGEVIKTAPYPPSANPSFPATSPRQSQPRSSYAAAAAGAHLQARTRPASTPNRPAARAPASPSSPPAHASARSRIPAAPPRTEPGPSGTGLPQTSGAPPPPPRAPPAAPPPSDNASSPAATGAVPMTA